MLNAEAQRHAGDKCLLQFAARDHLRAPDDEVVQQHAADYGEDHPEIELANPANGLAADVGRERRIDVHFAGSKFLSHTRMALSARLRQVAWMNRRAWIGGGEDAVRAVATGAVGYDLRP